MISQAGCDGTHLESQHSEAETRGLKVLDQPRLHRENMHQGEKNPKPKNNTRIRKYANLKKIALTASNLPNTTG
jgi:hypothetical protein